MEKKLRKSVVPIYAVGISWIAYAFLFPLYKGLHFILAAIFSLVIYFIASKIFKPKVVLVEKPLISKTGNERVDNILAEANGYIKSLRAYANNIANETVQAEARKIEEITLKILNYIATHPDNISDVRRFINYYLPTTNKLLSTYIELEKQKSDTENIKSTMQKIDDMLNDIIKAFNKQHDSLYEYKAMDIGAEISVMQDILTSEGLLDNDNNLQTTDKSNAIADFELAEGSSGITLTLEPEKEKIK